MKGRVILAVSLIFAGLLSGGVLHRFSPIFGALGVTLIVAGIILGTTTKIDD